MSDPFALSEEQIMLRESLSRFLGRRFDFDARQRAVAGEAGWDPAVWKGLADDVGVLGATVPEAQGGLGGGALDQRVIMEELGAALSGEPYLSTMVIGGAFLRESPALADRLLPRMVAGDAILGFAHAEPNRGFDLANPDTALEADGDGFVLNGHKAVVYAAPWASHFIVTARTGSGVSAVLVDAKAPGVALRTYPSIDGVRAADVRFDNVRVAADALLAPAGQALPLVERAVDEAIAAICAEAVGVMRRLLADSVAYAKERKQFGVPISSFQALQHRMADMLMALEIATAVANEAAAALSLPAEERARAISSAKVAIASACRKVGQGAVQIHGGMGMTEELAVGHYFKRATAIEALFGSSDYHLRRYASLEAKAA